ncbi:MAG: hypothetical protein AB7S97_04950 [Thermoplasmata archaeon]
MSVEAPAVKVMTQPEAEATVLRLLSEAGQMTTMEIERAAASVGRRCPDQTVLFLTKMRRRGLIRGEVSQERRGWLWSLP